MACKLGKDQELNCTRKVSEERRAWFYGAQDCCSVSGLYGVSLKQWGPLG